MRAFLILCLLVCEAGAATWYVRPSVHSSWNGPPPSHPIPDPGVYGTQTGISYANAWNGLQSVVWGPSGVASGDTLFVCGTHLYALSNYNNVNLQAAITVYGSNCTVRMDYATDPGLIFGGALDRGPNVLPWSGPDANGVYSISNYLFSKAMYWEVDGTNITRLGKVTGTTWAGDLGSWSSDANSNYLKTVSGNAPTNNIGESSYGWTLVIPITCSNVVFQSCTFIGGGISTDVPTFPPGPVPMNYCAHNITFRNCRILDCNAFQVSVSAMLPLAPGNDYWTFDSSEIGNGPSAIYSNVGYQSGTNQNRGVMGMVVTNCYIHDLDTTNYPAIDGHAIGAQDNSDCTFVANRIERTGTAIALFSYGMVMTNNLVARNFIKDIHWHIEGGATGGEGIWLSSQTNVSAGNRVIGNIILNTGLPGTGAHQSWVGSGIASSVPDFVDILNNTVVNTSIGINIAVTSLPANARIENNIVAGATNNLVHVSGSVGGSVTCDHNLYWTNVPCAVPFVLPTGQNAHSLFSNPLFASTNPVATAYRITSGSPAIQAGTAVGVTSDFLGHTYASPPSIGAFEYVGITNLAASCSQADIQAAIALSIPGDTVIVPAGTCAPTISILLTNQITLQAQGTILQDSIINTGDGANSSIIQVAVGPSPAVLTRITGFTFQTGARATKLFDSGNIHLGGGANMVRIDHCNFLATQNIGIGGGDVFGVIDHNVFSPPGAFTQPMKLTHASYGGAANGYGSWALPSWTNSYHEDASAIYIENNFFTNSSGSSGLGIDGFGGARWVSRYNIYDRVIDGGHGTETTAQYAGCRLKDVYNNLFIEHGDSEPGHWRSGSGACVSNTVISCPNQFQARNYRGAFGGFYHYANATNAWDLNDATIYAAGNATAGGTLTMTDSGQAWTPSQWIGYTIRNVSSGQGSIINASTATTVSYAPPTEGANMAFTPGQTYQFRKVVTILDEVGRGQGSLRNNTLPAWPNEVVDPVYNWANTFDGGSKLMDNGGYYTSVVGQEIINGPNANWLPYTYPHPLVGGSVAAVTITAQPHSTNVYASQTALFTITATGSPQPFTYQWTTNGVNAGTNGPALSVGPCPVAWSGMNVICVVANAAGFATSATATLTVLPDPVITAQPNNATVGVGSTASFSVSATGQTGLTYQWSKNGSSILGATHSSYVTPVTVSGDNNSQFFAVVTDSAGSLQSGNATLTVTNIISPPDPVITAQPQSTNIFATQPAAFSITATGGTPLSYQWKTNGVNSVTTQTLTFPSCPVVWSGMTIVCIVTDVAGSVTSSIATLTIGADPVIATQPRNTSRFANTTASFSVSATGQTALTYQWIRNGVSVAGATRSAYTTPILTMANNGDAYCVDSTDTAGTLRSANATLTVLPAPGGPTQIARVTTLRVGTTKAGP